MDAQKLKKPAIVAAGNTPAVRVPTRRRLLALVGSSALALTLAVVFAPLALWAYHIERAGQLLETGLYWPQPRQADSLPDVRYAPALAQAIDHLAYASRWQPARAHTYRMLGQAYAAQKDWQGAASAFAQASRLSPGNPLPAWEAGLAYEQIYQQVEAAPAQTITRILRDGTLSAPAAAVTTPFCQGTPQSCYLGLTTVDQNYAGFAGAVGLNARTLFLHPPAQLRAELFVPEDLPALRFAIGLLPEARAWASDGATFYLWVHAAGEPPQQVFSQALDAANARAGWAPGWADLSPWAGKMVTLTLETRGGPQNDTTGDWYGWASVAFTTLEAARNAALLPRARMVASWQQAGLDTAEFQARGDEARAAQREDEALRWYARAREMQLP